MSFRHNYRYPHVYLSVQTKVIDSLVAGDAFVEDIIDSFLFAPLQIPGSTFMFGPFAQGQCSVDAVGEGGFEGELGTG